MDLLRRFRPHRSNRRLGGGALVRSGYGLPSQWDAPCAGCWRRPDWWRSAIKISTTRLPSSRWLEP